MRGAASAAGRSRAARYLWMPAHGRHHAAEGMGCERAAHHARGDDVGPCHDRDRGRGNAHRRARLPGEARGAAAAPRHREARAAQPRGGRGAAARALGARALAGARRRQKAAGAARAGGRAAPAARRARHATGTVRAAACRAERALPVGRGAPRRAALRASRQGDRRDPVFPRPRAARARRAAQPRIPADARREAQGAAGVVFAARREEPGGEARLRSRPGGAALRAHPAPAGVARIRRGRARPRIAHARADGGGARLSPAAAVDCCAQRAAPPSGPAT